MFTTKISMTTTPSCDCCFTTLDSLGYEPYGTQRGASLYGCALCGLVQTVYQPTSPVPKKQTISSDANWGNVRHGKGLRFKDIRNYLNPVLQKFEPVSVLDIGSNRGDFVKFMLQQSYVRSVHALEPDNSLMHEYSECIQDDRLKISYARFEDSIHPHKYDFIYSFLPINI